MKNPLLTLIIGLCLISAGLQAQEMPNKPGPEIQKFSILSGKWKLDEIDEASPFGPAGKAAFKTTIRFVHNGFFVEESGRGKVGAISTSYTILYSFDSAARTYRSSYYDSNGVLLPGEGTFEGRIWKWHTTQDANGKTYKIKAQSVVAPDGKKFTYEWAYSEDGVNWKSWVKGTATKVGAI